MPVYPGIASFGLGQTYFNGGTVATSGDYGTTQSLEGTERTFENRTLTDPITVRHAGNLETLLVRNVSGITLLPGRGVRWKTGQEGKRVDGYVYVPSEEVAGIVDDRLPSTGVPDGDLFWLLRKGKCIVYTNNTTTSGGLAANISTRGPLVAATAATSQAPTQAGKFRLSATSLASSDNIGSVIEDNIRNCIGRALTARTTGETSAAILVDLNISQ